MVIVLAVVTGLTMAIAAIALLVALLAHHELRVLKQRVGALAITSDQRHAAAHETIGAVVTTLRTLFSALERKPEPVDQADAALKDMRVPFSQVM